MVLGEWHVEGSERRMERLKPHEDRDIGRAARSDVVSRWRTGAHPVCGGCEMGSLVQGARVCRSSAQAFEGIAPMRGGGDEYRRGPRFPSNLSGSDRGRRVAPDMGVLPAYASLGLTGTA